MMKLSIIIPVYNSSKILEKLVTEINLNLSVRFKNDYEIILVNDFSKDNSWDIIKKISKEFNFIKGPLFCNILLADEINRTPPKTQSALLQAMQENKVTAGGKTYNLDKPKLSITLAVIPIFSGS